MITPTTNTVSVGTGDINMVLLHHCKNPMTYSERNQCKNLPPLIYSRYIYSIIEHIISDCLGFDIEFRIPNDGVYGDGTLYGNATGVVKDVFDQKVDLSAPDFDMTYSRGLSTTFGPPLRHYGRVIMSKKGFISYDNSLRHWKAFTPLCLALWIIILVALWGIQRHAYRSSMLRVLMSISVLLFNSILGGKMVGTRSIEHNTMPFSSISQAGNAILNDGYRLVGAFNGTASMSTLMGSTMPKYRSIQAALNKYPFQHVGSKRLVRTLLDNSNSFAYNDQVLLKLMASNYSESFDWTYDQSSMVVQQSFMLPKTGSRFNGRVIMAALLIIESGLINNIEDYYINNRGRALILVKFATRNDIPIKLTDLSSTFYVFLVGQLTCMVYFVFEVYYARSRHFIK